MEQKQFVLHGGNLMQAVRMVTRYDMFLALEEVLPVLEVGRQEELVNEELLVEGKTNDFLPGPDRIAQWEVEELIEKKLIGT